jgi:hypothetical protein
MSLVLRNAEGLAIRDFRGLVPEYNFTAPLPLGEPEPEFGKLPKATKDLPARSDYAAVVLMAMRPLGSKDEPKLISVFSKGVGESPAQAMRNQFLKSQNKRGPSGSIRAHRRITANGHRAEYFGLVARVEGDAKKATALIKKRVSFLGNSPWRLEALDAYFPCAAAAAPAPAAAAEPEWVTFIQGGPLLIRNTRTKNVYLCDQSKHRLEDMAMRDRFEGVWRNGRVDPYGEEDEDAPSAPARPKPAAKAAAPAPTAALAAMTAERDALALTVARLEDEAARRDDEYSNLAAAHDALAETVARLEGEKARRRELRESLPAKLEDLADLQAMAATAKPSVAARLAAQVAELEAEIAAERAELAALE